MKSQKSLFGSLLCVVTLIASLSLSAATIYAAETTVPVEFTGGHEIGKNDYGRPVVLIAAALGVKPEVFREAFSGVTPAHGGGPSPEEARKNKSALMKVLAPHGISNDRLDEVSNYYRYRRQDGELWPTVKAKAHAIVENGKIKRIVVTDGGSGYCSLPEISVEGFDASAFRPKLQLSQDMKKNGAIAAIDVASSK